MNLHFPTRREVLSFITNSPEFHSHLKKAAELTLETGREASLEWQVDLIEGKRHLSEVGLGTEREAGSVKNTHHYSDTEYIVGLHLHSHPKESSTDFIFPSLGDICSGIAILSANGCNLMRQFEGKDHYPSADEALALAEKYCCSFFEAIIMAEEDKSIGMLFYEAGFPKRASEVPVNNQETALLSLREQEFKINFLRYFPNGNGRYQVREKYKAK